MRYIYNIKTFFLLLTIAIVVALVFISHATFNIDYFIRNKLGKESLSLSSDINLGVWANNFGEYESNDSNSLFYWKNEGIAVLCNPYYKGQRHQNYMGELIPTELLLALKKETTYMVEVNGKSRNIVFNKIIPITDDELRILKDNSRVKETDSTSSFIIISKESELLDDYD